MKYFFNIIVCCLYTQFINAQQPDTGNIEQRSVMKLAAQCLEYSTVNFDSAKYFGAQAVNLADKINYTSGKIIARCYLGIAYTRSGEIPKSLPLQFEGLKMAKDNNLPKEEALCHYTLGKSYLFLKDYNSAMRFFRDAHNGLNNFGEDNEINSYHVAFADIELSIGRLFMFSGKLDSALYYLQRVEKGNGEDFTDGVIKIFLGQAYFIDGQRALGLTYLTKVAKAKPHIQDDYTIAWACSILAGCYKEINQTDSAIYYAKIGLSAAQKINFKDRLLHINQLLAGLYEKIDLKESHNYLKKAVELNDELFGSDKIFQLQKAVAEQQQQIQEAEKKRLAYESNIKQYSLILGIVVILTIALLLYRNNRQKQTANKVLETTLNNLKSTQAQLIQSEKMASLGELTAGIAHEIQNPLNFVNNFSDVSNELIKEMKEEFKKGDVEEGFAIADDIEQNLEKINHHGKRASDIVKGMLEHSRKSTGEKQPTDINALCDEYLRLAYHGLKAKDNNFNATMETYFDPNLPKIDIIPQDIGRVILNLINNAFYAVNERSKKGESDYVPTVSITTLLIANSANTQLLIAIKDNGSGIPNSIKEKIFQPFFTTKPTGQGTGLGLSLSYDIVKAHGGELKVETNKREGCEFIITLPIQTKQNDGPTL